MAFQLKQQAADGGEVTFKLMEDLGNTQKVLLTPGKTGTIMTLTQFLVDIKGQSAVLEGGKALREAIEKALVGNTEETPLLTLRVSQGMVPMRNGQQRKGLIFAAERVETL